MTIEIILSLAIIIACFYTLNSLDNPPRAKGIYKITIVARDSDYMAFFNDDKRLWGCGKTYESALGSAIRTHYDLLKEPIQYPDFIPPWLNS